MRLVFIDVESYYDRKIGYSLGSMSQEAYIRDPRFELHGAAIKWSPKTSAVWYDERELRYILKQENWDDVFLVSHHAQWDHGVLSWRYDVHPKMSGCTLAMSRLVFGNHLSVSLDSVRKYFNLPPKTTPYGPSGFEGKHWHEMSPQLQHALAEGCKDEVESKVIIFQSLLRDYKFPPAELEVIDTIVKMFSEPCLELDSQMLAKLWESEAGRKAQEKAELGVDGAELRSAEKFCELLEAEGIEIEYKEGKNGEIPAIAKNDPFMRDFLLEHDNPRVQALAQARLGEKSTILQTRAETLGWVASRGTWPVYLFPYGASTIRPSGGGGANPLNFKRGSPLRRAVKAPKGHWLAPIDSAQLECRILHYLAGGPEDPVIKQFRNGEDPYVGIASKFYQEEIYKPKQDDPRYDEMTAKRGMGKQGRLMCLGPNTEVLTDNGIKPIVLVTLSDKLWDGDQWVKHQGLIYQGEQNVVEIKGVQMTSDHRVLCGPQAWLPAYCLLSADILSPALAVGLASLPLSVSKSVREVGYSNWLSDVRAERPSIPLIRRIFILASQHVVRRVPEKQLAFGLKNIMDMLIFAPIKNIGRDCLDASPRSMDVVTSEQNIRIMPITEVEESRFTDHGSEIVGLFSLIWSRSRDGIIPRFRLIGSKTTRAIVRVICSLRRQNNKRQTDVECVTYRKKSPTYDLSYAGPKNRFMIFSDQGPLIVHNCGFGASGKMFKATAASGNYGPRVDMTLEEAERFVSLYRSDNPSICARGTGYWAQCERVIARLAGGSPMQFGPMLVKDGRIFIQGRPMIYETMEYHAATPEDKIQKSGWRVKKRDGWKFMWGSKLTQNICEGVESVLIGEALVRIKKKYGIRTLNWPYDELLLLIPRDGREEEMLELCKAEMVREPEWLPGIPLACDGALGERYEK